MKFCHAAFLLALSMSLVSCLQPEGQPSGSIVVIGNGADAESTMVIDVHDMNIVQSHIVEDGARAEPVVQLIDDQEKPARINWIAKDEASGQKVVQVETPDSKPFIVNASEGMGKSEPISNLDDLKMARDHRPLFLSNGGILFINESQNLMYSADRSDRILIDRFVNAFFVDVNNRLFWNSGRTRWKYIALKDLPDVRADGFDADFVFLTKDGRVSALIWKSLSNKMKHKGLYELQDDDEFLKVAELGDDQEILDVRTAPFNERGNTILAKLGSKSSDVAEWKALSLGNKKFSIWPSQMKLSGESLIYSGADIVTVQNDKSQSELEVCRQIESEFSCKALSLDFEPQSVTLGTKDSLYVTRATGDGETMNSEVNEVQIRLMEEDFGKNIGKYEFSGTVESLRFFPDLKLISGR